MYNDKNELIYSVKTSDDVGNECTGIYRNPKFYNEIIDNFYDNPVNNLWEKFCEVSEKYKNNDCMGTRVKENGKLGNFKWKTYSEVKEIIKYVGSGLMNINACPLINCDDNILKEGRFLGLYMVNNEEWMYSDLACNAYNIISVPLYDSLGADSSEFILKQTLMESIVCNYECAIKLFDCLKTSKDVYIKRFIFVGEIDEKIKELCKSMNIELILWDDLINEGKKNILPPKPGALDDVVTICYTSGTTGQPKGVLITNGNYIASLAGSILYPSKFPHVQLNENDVHLSYLPLAHIFERMNILICLSFGVKIGFFSGNIKTLFDDIQVLKPTIFVSVPRLFNRLHERIFMSLKKKSFIIQTLFNRGISQKIKKLNSTGNSTHALWDRLIFNKAKKLLGGNVKFMINGSSPVSADIFRKLRCILCVPVLEGYGMTESVGPAFISHSNDPELGHIGGPLPHLEYKIVSVPEMNYFITDDPPKGEIYIRGPAVCKLGYFKMKEQTDEIFTPDGWICTGDIVMLNKNGSVKVIDRKKNIFKLSQGEYIAVEKIECSYKQSLFIDQIFVFGYSSESFLVCVIYPSLESLEEWKKKKRLNKPDEEIILLSEYKEEVLNDLTKIGKSDGLNGYEQVKDIYFTLEAFTIENDLLTPTGKIKRHLALKKYKTQIDEMYRRKQSL